MTMQNAVNIRNMRKPSMPGEVNRVTCSARTRLRRAVSLLAAFKPGVSPETTHSAYAFSDKSHRHKKKRAQDCRSVPPRLTTAHNLPNQQPALFQRKSLEEGCSYFSKGRNFGRIANADMIKNSLQV